MKTIDFATLPIGTKVYFAGHQGEIFNISPNRLKPVLVRVIHDN